MRATSIVTSGNCSLSINEQELMQKKCYTWKKKKKTFIGIGQATDMRRQNEICAEFGIRFFFCWVTVRNRKGFWHRTFQGLRFFSCMFTKLYPNHKHILHQFIWCTISSKILCNYRNTSKKNTCKMRIFMYLYVIYGHFIKICIICCGSNKSKTAKTNSLSLSLPHS